VLEARDDFDESVEPRVIDLHDSRRERAIEALGS
jgi:hypothetical protein